MAKTYKITGNIEKTKNGYRVPINITIDGETRATYYSRKLKRELTADITKGVPLQQHADSAHFENGFIVHKWSIGIGGMQPI